MSNPHDEIQCEDYYGDEPDWWVDGPGPDPDEDEDLEDDVHWEHDPFERDHPADAWVMADGSTGPAGERFLASLTPEDFV